MNKRVISILGGVLLGFSGHAGASVTVDVNLDVTHSVGSVSEFDREAYIVLHAGLRDNEWDSAAQRDVLLNDYDVYLGRNNGSLPWGLSQSHEDPAKAGWVDHVELAKDGASSISTYAADSVVHPLESRSRKMMIGGQMSMYPGYQTYPKNNLTITNYAALGDFYEHYLTYFYGVGGTDGEPKPAMVEVVNEPFVAASKHGTTRENVAQMHNEVAEKIKQSHPDVLVGGYTAAHPQYEGNDFAHWNDNWKMFIDTAGENMDFFSLHLYDNPGGSTNVLEHQYRSGSNVEALLDMIEHYSMIQLGEVKPFNISEYGSLSVYDNTMPYDPKNDWVDVRSFNTIMMQLLERPDRMLQAIPFMILKAEWGRDKGGTEYPYPTRLLYDVDELNGDPTSNDGPWEYTHRLKFFEFWKEVNGTRVDTISSNPDIQIDAYVDGANAFVILSSLDHTGPQTVKLNLFGENQNVEEVLVKNSYADETGMPTLGASGSAVMKYVFASDVQQDQSSLEAKYYATDYLKPISAHTPIEFNITNVVYSSAYGEAVLRLGLGRAHGKSLKPTLLVNGVEVEMPDNWRGYDQWNRDSFYGVIEVPVPYELIETNNTISLEFNDADGHVASVGLQVFEFTKDIRNRVKTIPVEYHQFVDGDLILGFTNGPVGGYYGLKESTNLVDGAWETVDYGLSISGRQGAITNQVVHPQAFYVFYESEAPPVAATNIVILPETDVLAVGRMLVLNATVQPDNAENKTILWSSSDPSVATVSDGAVYGVADGYAVITGATEDGGFSDTCGVTVETSNAGIDFDDWNKYRNQEFDSVADLTVTCDFDAGPGEEVNSAGVKFWLREIDDSSGSWKVQNDHTVIDYSVVGQDSGQSSGTISLEGVPTSAAIGDNFYYLYISFTSTDGASHKVGLQPVIITVP